MCLAERDLHSPLSARIAEDRLALATFVSAQTTTAGWTKNDLELALDAISAGWPFPDGSRWGLVYVDMNFATGKRRDLAETFGRTIIEALPKQPEASLQRLPVVMFSSDTPENVERQLGPDANVQVISKWAGGAGEDAIRARREFGRVLFKEALAQDGTLRYVRDDGRVVRIERKNPIVGASLDLLETLRDARKILARSKDARILVTGERGSGKELLAEYLHAHRMPAKQYSERVPATGAREGELVVVHLKETPPELFASALKGHKKGAYTDAKDDEDGPIKTSKGGTVHLDEIGNLRVPELQMLLRLVESKEYSPVGSSNKIDIDCQFVATTNKNVIAMLAKGEFPEDLYDRFEKLAMPALRDRPSDIRPLFEHFLRAEVAKLGCRRKEVDEGVWERVQRERWQGNVRQLKSVVETIVSDREYASRIRVADFDRAWERSGDVVGASWRGGFAELIEMISTFEVTANTPLEGSYTRLEKAQLKLWKALTTESIRRDSAMRSGRPQKTAVVTQLLGRPPKDDPDRWLGDKLAKWQTITGDSDPDFAQGMFDLLGGANQKRVSGKLNRKALP
jgi:DNA-binding NtrC family response regulator